MASRLHRDVLSLQSDVFKGVFPLPPHADNETLDDRPVSQIVEHT